MKKIFIVVLAVVVAALPLCLISCGNTTQPTTAPTGGSQTGSAATATPTPDPGSATGDATPNPTETGATDTGDVQTGDPTTGDPVIYEIRLSDASIDVGSSGATVDGKTLKISRAGSYRLIGSLSDGAIVVAVSKEETVDLILAGVTVTNKTGPAVFCDSADKLYITTEEGSVNTLSDGKNYALPDGPNAAIYSDDDLTLRGTGTLNVIGRFKNGISSKNDVKIKELTLRIESYNTGIRGKGSVTVTDGNIEIIAGNDGIKANEETKPDKGFVEINGGTLVITAGDDGIQASTTLTVAAGCSLTITAEGKKTNAPTENIAEGTLK